MNKPTSDASAAAGSTLAVGSALNLRQQSALDAFGSDWKRAPLRTASATLLSLQKRGLLECRITPGAMPHLDHCAAYNGYAFQWRKPNISSQRTRHPMPDHQQTEAPTQEQRPGSL